MKAFLCLSALLLTLAIPNAGAGTPTGLADTEWQPIQEKWAEIKFRRAEAEQPEAFKHLAVRAHQLVESYPNYPEPLILEGITLASEAETRRGLSGLTLAKEARCLLEESLKLNETAMNAAAYTGLGMLYAKVPVWPLAFGDKKKAEDYFRKALQANPKGIDQNYYFAQYLMAQARYQEARPLLERLLKEPVRQGRELADHTYRQQAQELLAKLYKEGK